MSAPNRPGAQCFPCGTKKAELVKLRYFVGLNLDKAASVLEISGPKAKRWGAYSRAWLKEETDKQR